MAALLGNPITSIASLSGYLLIAVIAVLLFIEETGVPIPFAPGDVLLLIAGISIASDAVDPIPMLAALLVAISAGALLGREVFAAIGRPAVLKIADALRFRDAFERATKRLQRGGAPAVFIARLIPGLRIQTTQAAGVSDMPRLTFLAGLFPSVAVYITVFVGLGALAGRPAVGLFHRAQQRFFIVAVILLAVAAVVLSIRWLGRRGALNVLEPIVLGVRRDFADSLERRLFSGGKDDLTWRQYPVVRRVWAGIIDFVITGGLAILTLTAVSGFGQTEELFDPPGVLLLAGMALVYRVPYEALTGQSVGKVMMGISVYGPEGSVPGWVRALIRNFVGIVPIAWPVDVVLVLRNGRRQRLGDMLSKATVQRVAV